MATRNMNSAVENDGASVKSGTNELESSSYGSTDFELAGAFGCSFEYFPLWPLQLPSTLLRLFDQEGE
jgi:hypothetical protein